MECPKSRRFPLGTSFGVMQGRLSEMSDRGYQAFPWATWRSEFSLAAQRGLEHVEWVLDTWHVRENPLLISPDEVSSEVQRTGVNVISVCADFLMDTPLDRQNRQSWDVVENLLAKMHSLGIHWLVVPCVDQASLRMPLALRRFEGAAKELVKMLEGTDVKISIESDLAPKDFAKLLYNLDPNAFGANYDIGNSASLGYRVEEEFDEYGSRINLVHMKDRRLNQESVFLGTGDADIPQVVGLLDAYTFSGPVTMQAYRDWEGVQILDSQLEWLMALIGNRA